MASEPETRIIVIDGKSVVVSGDQIKLDTLDQYFGDEKKVKFNPAGPKVFEAKRARGEILKASNDQLENLIP